MAVSHNSRDWRTMSLSHSALWATILIDEQLAGVGKLVELFLFRAGTRPLDVVMHVPKSKVAQEAQMTFQMVLEVSIRWCSLAYAWAELPHHLHRIVVTLRDIPLPRLEALHLAGGLRGQSRMEWSLMGQLVASSALRSLRFSGVRLRFESVLAPRTISSNLTTFELDASTTSSMFKVSRLRDVGLEMPKLQRLALGGFVPWMDPEGVDPVEPISLPALRYF